MNELYDNDWATTTAAGESPAERTMNELYDDDSDGEPGKTIEVLKKILASGAATVTIRLVGAVLVLYAFVSIVAYTLTFVDLRVLTPTSPNPLDGIPLLAAGFVALTLILKGGLVLASWRWQDYDDWYSAAGRAATSFSTFNLASWWVLVLALASGASHFFF